LFAIITHMNAESIHLQPLPDSPAALAKGVRAAGSSFYWAMRLLPPERRTGVFAIYAFCRAVDDIADGPKSRDAKIDALDAWHHHIDALYAGDARSEPMLFNTVQKFQLNKADFHAVIDGMEMDARGPIVAPTMAELDLYCDRVASAVGRLCNPVFGDISPQARALADHLGRALQLTNIIRDCEEDAAIGRLYLPLELLEEQNVKSRDPVMVMRDKNLPNVLRRLGNVADKAFAQADGALQRCNPSAMRPPTVMMHVYRHNWRKMRDADWQPQQFQRGSKVGKMLIAFKVGILGIKSKL
jgi:presqualene diphosphate synthase